MKDYMILHMTYFCNFAPGVSGESPDVILSTNRAGIPQETLGQNYKNKLCAKSYYLLFKTNPVKKY